MPLFYTCTLIRPVFIYITDLIRISNKYVRPCADVTSAYVRLFILCVRKVDIDLGGGSCYR